MHLGGNGDPSIDIFQSMHKSPFPLQEMKHYTTNCLSHCESNQSLPKMYSGADKYSGNVVGQEKQATDLSCLEQVIETSSAEETIEVNVPYDAGDGTVKVQTVLLKAKLNPDGGGLQWIQEDDTTSSYNTVVAMSQMTSMLRDLDRNRKYEMMIKNSIHNFKSEHGYAPVVRKLISLVYDKL